MQRRLLSEVYQECGVDPSQVSFVEAHGTGTPAGDPVEMSVLADIFCEGRTSPLLVGSVKSNMGNSGHASGLCSVVKLLIAMETGLIPPNLHFQNPNREIRPLLDGRIRVVAEPTPFDGRYAAFNSFGFGGVNVHAVLEARTRDGEVREVPNPLPQLALYGGQTEESVKSVMEHVEHAVPSREFFALLHQSAFAPSHAMPYRGYTVVGSEHEGEGIKCTTAEKRPVWFVFSGIGVQWPGMAKDLMDIKVFADSIRESAKLVQPYGLDLTHLVSDEKADLRGIIPNFVSNVAMHIALVDVLTALGINPDGVVGHSFGELSCGYVDGCLTAEQALMSAYWWGRALEEAGLDEGSMAVVGLTQSEAKKRCPKDLFPSGHNAEDSVTIAGPKASVALFVDKLKGENVSAKEINSSVIAFHTPYVSRAVEKLPAPLKQLIPTPKQRSSRWISTSYPEEQWHEPAAKLADASYYGHNLVAPLLSREALQHVPKNAIVVQTSPHHLFHATTKKNIGPNAEYIGLMRRNVDNAVLLLSSIGRLYSVGLNPDIEKLYPAVTLPVPRGTPMITPLIRWDHSESWGVAKWGKDTPRSQSVGEVNPGVEDSP